MPPRSGPRRRRAAERDGSVREGPAYRSTARGLAVALALASAALGATVRLWNRPPTPVRAQLERELHATIVSDLTNAGAVGSNAERLADRALRSGRYTVQTGPFAGQTIDIRAETARFLPALESLYTYPAGGKRFAYLPDPDSYHYLAAADRLERTGRAWRAGPDRRGRDPLSRAPRGYPSDGSWHPGVLAVWHRVLDALGRSLPLAAAAAWLPVALGVAAALPVLALAALAGGAWAAPAAGVVLAFMVGLVGRTSWGHADTDLYNVLFPTTAATLLALALALLARRRRSGAGLLTALAGALTGVYTRFWTAWWAPALMLTAAAGIAAFGLAIWRGGRRLDARLVQQVVLLPAAYALTTLFAAGLFAGPGTIADVWRGPRQYAGAARLGDAAALWPDLFATVGELGRPGLRALTADLGGWLGIGLAVVGLVFALGERGRPARRATGLLVGAWALVGLLLAARAVRFELLAAPALATLAGNGAAALGRQLARLVPGEKARAYATGPLGIVVAIVVVAVPGGPVSQVRAAARLDLPRVTSTWGRVLDVVRERTDRTAVLTTWWDMGHVTKFLSERGVTTDGVSFAEPESFWTARALTTSDERLAVGILRMLDAGGSRALDALADSFGVPRADALLEQALAAPDSAGFVAALARGGAAEGAIARVVALARARPPALREGVVVVSDQLVPTAAAWAAIGSWDFTRAAALRAYRTHADAAALAAQVHIGRAEAESLLAVVAALPDSERAKWPGPGPTVLRGPEPAGLDQSGVLRAPSGAWVDLRTGLAGLSPEDGGGTPASVVFQEPNGVYAARSLAAGGGSDLALVVVPGPNGASLLTTNRRLAESLCLRLLYFRGAGLARFRLLAEAEGIRGGAVRAYRVVW